MEFLLIHPNFPASPTNLPIHTYHPAPGRSMSSTRCFSTLTLSSDTSHSLMQAQTIAHLGSAHNVHIPSPTALADSPSFATGHNALSTTLARDAIMTYAYYLYDSPRPASTPLGLTSVPILYAPPESQAPDYTYRHLLLPLLLSLLEHHPHHLPILLLLACTYYALGDHDSSLAISHKILSINSDYVESMSNIGTTMKALGQTEKAYEWWWKALQLRPTYWDALVSTGLSLMLSCHSSFWAKDNILGMTFTLAHSTLDHGRRLAYYRHAQAICHFVEKQVLQPNGNLSVALQPSDISRLQRAILTSGTIYATLGPTNAERAVLQHTRALELVIRSPPPDSDGEQYTVRDLLIAACVAGHHLCSGSDMSGAFVSGMLQSVAGPRLGDPTFDLIHLVHTSGDQLLLRAGGVLPTPLLFPDEVTHLRTLLFPQTAGVFPAICTRTPAGDLKPPSDSVRQQTSSMTSTVLLTLAKRFQDNTQGSMVIPGSGSNLRVSVSVIILLYYLALAWSPAPSTYNNLGIVLSGITEARRGPDGEQLDGTTLARVFYTAGLQLDPEHAHLLTNLGSLLKDQGHIEQAIK